MKKSILRRLLKGSSFVFIFLSHLQLLYAQSDIERSTRETDRLQRREIIEETLRQIPKKVSAEEEAEETPVALPEGKEEKFFLKKINLVGCESFSAESFSSLLKEYENREVSISELENLSKNIEREYLNRGIITAVFLPPQELKDQSLFLQVVEARMGELEIQEHKYFKEDRLDYYWQIPRQEIIRYDKISKAIQMMNKNPDREVKAALHAGKETGTTDVLLSSKVRFPLHLVASFDNEGSTPTGRSKSGLGLRYNNFLGLDDVLLTGYTFTRDLEGTHTYHSLPISPNGTTLVYGYSRTSAKPSKEFAASRIKSETKNASVSLHQDLYKKDEYKGEVSLTFEAKDKNITRDTGTANRDRLRIFRFGSMFVIQGLGSSTTISPEFSQGLNAFGASSRDNPLVSRGAKSQFSKFNLNLGFKKKLPLNMSSSLKFKSQISSTKLTPQEEFGLGGLDSVRGYPSADYLADNGLLLNSELLLPIKDLATGVLFLDYGWGNRRSPLPEDRKHVRMAGVGGGFRIKFFDQALLRLEWAIPVGDRPITETGNSRFHLALDFQDNLPEEIERIAKLIEEQNISQWSWNLINAELAQPESPLKKKIYYYLYLAHAYQKSGKFKEAKELYEKITETAGALFKQAEEYVRMSLKHQEELKEYSRLAQTNCRQGKFKEAKTIWQKILNEAKPKPLVLKF